MSEVLKEGYIQQVERKIDQNPILNQYSIGLLDGISHLLDADLHEISSISIANVLKESLSARQQLSSIDPEDELGLNEDVENVESIEEAIKDNNDDDNKEVSEEKTDEAIKDFSGDILQLVQEYHTDQLQEMDRVLEELLGEVDFHEGVEAQALVKQAAEQVFGARAAAELRHHSAEWIPRVRQAEQQWQREHGQKMQEMDRVLEELLGEVDFHEGVEAQALVKQAAEQVFGARAAAELRHHSAEWIPRVRQAEQQWQREHGQKMQEMDRVLEELLGEVDFHEGVEAQALVKQAAEQVFGARAAAELRHHSAEWIPRVRQAEQQWQREHGQKMQEMDRVLEELLGEVDFHEGVEAQALVKQAAEQVFGARAAAELRHHSAEWIPRVRQAEQQWQREHGQKMQEMDRVLEELLGEVDFHEGVEAQALVKQAAEQVFGARAAAELRHHSAEWIPRVRQAEQQWQREHGQKMQEMDRVLEELLGEVDFHEGVEAQALVKQAAEQVFGARAAAELRHHSAEWIPRVRQAEQQWQREHGQKMQEMDRVLEELLGEVDFHEGVEAQALVKQAAEQVFGARAAAELRHHSAEWIPRVRQAEQQWQREHGQKMQEMDRVLEELLGEVDFHEGVEAQALVKQAAEQVFGARAAAELRHHSAEWIPRVRQAEQQWQREHGQKMQEMDRVLEELLGEVDFHEGVEAQALVKQAAEQVFGARAAAELRHHSAEWIPRVRQAEQQWQREHGQKMQEMDRVLEELLGEVDFHEGVEAQALVKQAAEQVFGARAAAELRHHSAEWIPRVRQAEQQWQREHGQKMQEMDRVLEELLGEVDFHEGVEAQALVKQAAEQVFGARAAAELRHHSAEWIPRVRQAEQQWQREHGQKMQEMDRVLEELLGEVDFHEGVEAQALVKQAAEQVFGARAAAELRHHSAEWIPRVRQAEQQWQREHGQKMQEMDRVLEELLGEVDFHEGVEAQALVKQAAEQVFGARAAAELRHHSAEWIPRVRQAEQQWQREHGQKMQEMDRVLEELLGEVDFHEGVEAQALVKQAAEQVFGARAAAELRHHSAEWIPRVRQAEQQWQREHGQKMQEMDRVLEELLGEVDFHEGVEAQALVKQAAEQVFGARAAAELRHHSAEWIPRVRQAEQQWQREHGQKMQEMDRVLEELLGEVDFHEGVEAQALVKQAAEQVFGARAAAELRHHSAEWIPRVRQAEQQWQREHGQKMQEMDRVLEELLGEVDFHEGVEAQALVKQAAEQVFGARAAAELRHHSAEWIPRVRQAEQQWQREHGQKMQEMDRVLEELLGEVDFHEGVEAQALVKQAAEQVFGARAAAELRHHSAEWIPRVRQAEQQWQREHGQKMQEMDRVLEELLGEVDFHEGVEAQALVKQAAEQVFGARAAAELRHHSAEWIPRVRQAEQQWQREHGQKMQEMDRVLEELLGEVDFHEGVEAQALVKQAAEQVFGARAAAELRHHSAEWIPRVRQAEQQWQREHGQKMQEMDRVLEELLGEVDFHEGVEAQALVKQAAEQVFGARAAAELRHHSAEWIPRVRQAEQQWQREHGQKMQEMDRVLEELLGEVDFHEGVEAQALVKQAAEQVFGARAAAELRHHSAEWIPRVRQAEQQWQREHGQKMQEMDRVLEELLGEVDFHEGVEAQALVKQAAEQVFGARAAAELRHHSAEWIPRVRQAEQQWQREHGQKMQEMDRVLEELLGEVDFHEGVEAQALVKQAAEQVFGARAAAELRHHSAEWIPRVRQAEQQWQREHGQKMQEMDRVLEELLGEVDFHEGVEAQALVKQAAEQVFGARAAAELRHHSAEWIPRVRQAEQQWQREHGQKMQEMDRVLEELLGEVDFHEGVEAQALVKQAAEQVFGARAAAELRHHSAEWIPRVRQAEQQWQREHGQKMKILEINIVHWSQALTENLEQIQSLDDLLNAYLQANTQDAKDIKRDWDNRFQTVFQQAYKDVAQRYEKESDQKLADAKTASHGILILSQQDLNNETFQDLHIFENAMLNRVTYLIEHLPQDRRKEFTKYVQSLISNLHKEWLAEHKSDTEEKLKELIGVIDRCLDAIDDHQLFLLSANKPDFYGHLQNNVTDILERHVDTTLGTALKAHFQDRSIELYALHRKAYDQAIERSQAEISQLSLNDQDLKEEFTEQSLATYMHRTLRSLTVFQEHVPSALMNLLEQRIGSLFQQWQQQKIDQQEQEKLSKEKEEKSEQENLQQQERIEKEQEEKLEQEKERGKEQLEKEEQENIEIEMRQETKGEEQEQQQLEEDELEQEETETLINETEVKKLIDTALVLSQSEKKTMPLQKKLFDQLMQRKVQDALRTYFPYKKIPDEFQRYIDISLERAWKNHLTTAVNTPSKDTNKSIKTSDEEQMKDTKTLLKNRITRLQTESQSDALSSPPAQQESSESPLETQEQSALDIINQKKERFQVCAGMDWKELEKELDLDEKQSERMVNRFSILLQSAGLRNFLLDGNQALRFGHSVLRLCAKIEGSQFMDMAQGLRLETNPNRIEMFLRNTEASQRAQVEEGAINDMNSEDATRRIHGTDISKYLNAQLYPEGAERLWQLLGGSLPLQQMVRGYEKNFVPFLAAFFDTLSPAQYETCQLMFMHGALKPEDMWERILSDPALYRKVHDIQLSSPTAWNEFQKGREKQGWEESGVEHIPKYQHVDNPENVEISTARETEEIEFEEDAIETESVSGEILHEEREQIDLEDYNEEKEFIDDDTSVSITEMDDTFIVTDAQIDTETDKQVVTTNHHIVVEDMSKIDILIDEGAETVTVTSDDLTEQEVVGFDHEAMIVDEEESTVVSASEEEISDQILLTPEEVGIETMAEGDEGTLEMVTDENETMTEWVSLDQETNDVVMEEQIEVVNQEQIMSGIDALADEGTEAVTVTSDDLTEQEVVGFDHEAMIVDEEESTVVSASEEEISDQIPLTPEEVGIETMAEGDEGTLEMVTDENETMTEWVSLDQETNDVVMEEQIEVVNQEQIMSGIDALADEGAEAVTVTSDDLTEQEVVGFDHEAMIVDEEESTVVSASEEEISDQIPLTPEEVGIETMAEGDEGTLEMVTDENETMTEWVSLDQETNDVVMEEQIEVVNQEQIMSGIDALADEGAEAVTVTSDDLTEQEVVGFDHEAMIVDEEESTVVSASEEEISDQIPLTPEEVGIETMAEGDEGTLEMVTDENETMTEWVSLDQETNDVVMEEQIEVVNQEQIMSGIDALADEGAEAVTVTSDDLTEQEVVGFDHEAMIVDEEESTVVSASEEEISDQIPLTPEEVGIETMAEPEDYQLIAEDGSDIVTIEKSHIMELLFDTQTNPITATHTEHLVPFTIDEALSHRIEALIAKQLDQYSEFTSAPIEILRLSYRDITISLIKQIIDFAQNTDIESLLQNEEGDIEQLAIADNLNMEPATIVEELKEENACEYISTIWPMTQMRGPEQKEYERFMGAMSLRNFLRRFSSVAKARFPQLQVQINIPEDYLESGVSNHMQLSEVMSDFWFDCFTRQKEISCITFLVSTRRKNVNVLNLTMNVLGAKGVESRSFMCILEQEVRTSTKKDMPISARQKTEAVKHSTAVQSSIAKAVAV